MNSLTRTAGIMGYLMLLGTPAAQVLGQDAMSIDGNGSIGIGTDTPLQKFHVEGGNMLVRQSSGTDAILEFASGVHLWRVTQNNATGRLVFFYPGGGAVTGSFKFDPSGVENLLRVGVKGANVVDVAGNLEVNGDLIVNGLIRQPDYVFDRAHKVESIEKHAEFMWTNRHLPSVPAAGPENIGPVNVLELQMGILEELEKAHIYIEQLNTEMKSMRAALAAKAEQLTALRIQIESASP